MIRFLLVLVFALPGSPLQAAPKNTLPTSYRLGIFPYMAPRQTVEFYGPIAANMQSVLKHPVKLESAPTFPEFSRAMTKYQYDIALIQPFDFPEMVEKLGYVPIAQFAVPLVTQFYVRDDSKYQKITDLEATAIAMPPAPAANSRMALRALNDNKLVPGKNVTVNYFNSHDSCIQQVWAGTASACATSKPPILVFEQRMQAKLRAIYDTPPIPHVMFVANPRMPAKQRDILRVLITGWSQHESGRAMLKNLGFPGFVNPKPAEYAMMRNYEPAAEKKITKPAAPKELILGVFPFLNTRQIAQNFAPVLPALGKSIDMTIHLRTASSFDAFSEALKSSAYDLIIVQPFDYAKAIQQGYLPLASMKNWLEGTFFVLDSSPYKTIADFRGKVVAMPPENSAQSHLGRLALHQAGLEIGSDITIDYRKTHDSCLQQVQRGEAIACVTAELTLAMLPKELSDNLRPVGKTEKVPGVLIMAHKRITAKKRDQLQGEIIAWQHSENGRKILTSMGLGDFVTPNQADYELIKEF